MEVLIKTKYNGEIDLEVYKKYCVNNIFKILPLMENNQEWESHLKGFLVELSGIKELTREARFIALIGKLEGLFSLVENGEVKDKELFRKVVLDAIPLMKSIADGDSNGSVE